MWKLYRKEDWAPKNWCFKLELEKTLESPLDSKEINPVNPKGNQPLIFIGRTDAKAETSILLASWCEELTHWKRPWCWERLKAGGEEDERGWDGWMTPLPQRTWVWVCSGSWWWMGRLVCYNPWCHKDSDTNEWLKHTVIYMHTYIQRAIWNIYIVYHM